MLDELEPVVLVVLDAVAGEIEQEQIPGIETGGHFRGRVDDLLAAVAAQQADFIEPGGVLKEAVEARAVAVDAGQAADRWILVFLDPCD